MVMRVASVNCSYWGMRPGDTIYNLGAEKIANYHRALGDEVYCGPWAPLALQDVGKFYFSVIFTWDVPALIRAVNMARKWGREVEIGGPAATFMHTYIHRKTGVEPHRGLDPRFERVPGDYEMTFTSRGCPHGCKFCGVKRVEPVAIEYDDFPLARMIGDNNLTATSWTHQEHVVNRWVNFEGEIDINSGFDVRFFTEDHLRLYAPLQLESFARGRHWRFAFDTMEVEEDVRRVAAMMRDAGMDRHHVAFYCLIGFPGQTPDECHYRLRTIIELGFNPYPMRFTPLNSLKRNWVGKGWSEDLLQRMSAYYQTPYLWMTDTWENFVPGKKIVKIPREQMAFVGEEM